MQIYLAYNLRLQSELALPELMPAVGMDQPDVVIRFGTIAQTHPSVDRSHHALAEEPGVGHFLVRDGCEIVIEPVDRVEDGLLRTILLGPIFTILLQQRGLLVLHASAVNIANRAIVFLGGSGFGKSTLVTAFHQQGYDVLTDDVLPVQLGEGSLVVFPAYPQFKLCADAAVSLSRNGKGLTPIFQTAPKLAYTFTDGFQQVPLPLHHLYLLGKGDRHELIPLDPKTAFLHLVQHTRAMNHIVSAELLPAHFQMCTALVKRVGCSLFLRKPALEALPALVEMITADVLQSMQLSNGSKAEAYPAQTVQLSCTSP